LRLETMLRISFLQQWHALSDPMAEAMLYDSDAMHRFAGIKPGDDRVPDETTILNFRHLLDKHPLTEKLFAGVNGRLADQGVTLCSGTLVDATIVNAPSSTPIQNNLELQCSCGDMSTACRDQCFKDSSQTICAAQHKSRDKHNSGHGYNCLKSLVPPERLELPTH